jgi:hypothetical protein
MNSSTVPFSKILHQFLTECNLLPLETGWIPLEMTEAGWIRAQNMCPRKKGVYIHATADGIPLRVGIGLGSEGIYGRWFHALACHKHSFLQWKKQPLNYKSFFKQISEQYQQTVLFYLLMEDEIAKRTEKRLCEVFLPVWEIQNFESKRIWKNNSTFAIHKPTLEESILLRSVVVDNQYRVL